MPNQSIMPENLDKFQLPDHERDKTKKRLSFGKAFELLKSKKFDYMCSTGWKGSMQVRIQFPAEEIANTVLPYLFIVSHIEEQVVIFPWIPNSIDLFCEEWEVHLDEKQDIHEEEPSIEEAEHEEIPEEEHEVEEESQEELVDNTEEKDENGEHSES